MGLSSIFNSLSLLHDAVPVMNGFIGVDGDIIHEALCADLSTVVAKYPAESARRGIALVHRHFELHDDEVLLHEGNVSKPVPLSSNLIETLAPVAWVFCESEPIAYEYAVAKDEQPLDVEFARDVLAVLSKYGLDRSLGLSTIDGEPGRVEYTTESRENITEPLGLHPRGGDLIATSWTLDSLSKNSPPMRTYTMCVQTTVYVNGIATAWSHTTVRDGQGNCIIPEITD
jgi:hypothetical protein